MTWEDSNEHIGLQLIPYKQPARSGEGRGGGRWSSFPGGLEEKSPPCVCMCVCACLCAHMSCLCALYTRTYILELIINLMLFSRNPLPYQTLGVKLWFPGSLELLHQGLCTGPSPARSSFPSWGSPPACRTLSGGYLAALLIPCRLPVSAVVDRERGGPDYTSCLLLLCWLLSLCLP